MAQADRIKFNLLDNALDYLLRAAESAAHNTPREWKYALLHLVSGIELIIKARLNREHWTLLFANVDNANRESLDKGDFVSVDSKAAIERLSNIAEVQLSDNASRRLDDLRRYRNQVQHFGIDVDRSSIVPLLAYGYHFCLDFIQEHLPDDLDDERRGAMERMAQSLVEFDEFVTVRLEELKVRLDDAYMLVDCPRCWRRALELGDGDPRCLFCNFTATSDQVVAESDVVAGPEECPECGGPCVGLYDERGEFPGWVCFRCGQQGDYEHCSRCGMLSGNLRPGDHCSSCWNAMIEKD